MAGEVIGPAALVAVKATRGISSPVVVDAMSSIADATGAAPVELIPTFCDNAIWQMASDIIRNNESFFMVLSNFDPDFGRISCIVYGTKDGIHLLP